MRSDTIEIEGGFTRFPNVLLDRVFPSIPNLAAREVYRTIIRRTIGFNCESVKASHNYIANALNIARSSVQSSIRLLNERNLIISLRSSQSSILEHRVVGVVRTPSGKCIFDSSQLKFTIPENGIAVFSKAGTKFEAVAKPNSGSNKRNKETDKENTTHTFPVEFSDAETFVTFLSSQWNHVCVGLPRLEQLNASRRDAASQLFREKPESTYWKAVIEKVAQSPFCNGENKTQWRASFDWLLKNHWKVHEGNYDSKPLQNHVQHDLKTPRIIAVEN